MERFPLDLVHGGEANATGSVLLYMVSRVRADEEAAVQSAQQLMS